MSDTPQYQEKSYECSIQNSSIKLSNAEWINEFSNGIKLEKGDSVRLLGSFVHENSSGEEIQIDKDTSFNMSFNPYIKPTTYGTADKATNLMDLSNISDLAYSTDAFGIEPPLWWDSRTVVEAESVTYNQANGDNNMFADPLATGIQTNYQLGIDKEATAGLGPFAMVCYNEPARTWGTNIPTSIFAGKGSGFDIVQGQDYKQFVDNSVPNEMYIAGMVKKYILPVIDNLRTCNRDTARMFGEGAVPTNFTERLMEDLILDPPTDTAGCFAGVPKPGMCFATVNIGGSTGWYDDQGGAFFEGTWGSIGPGDQTSNGQPNTKAGVESVVGTILAVRPIKINLMGKVQDAYEIYVHDWVNPANYSSKMIEHTFQINELRSAYHYNDTNDVPFVNGRTAYKMIHGAGARRNGYSENPQYNNINGTFNTVYRNTSAPSSFGDGVCEGQYNATPTDLFSKELEVELDRSGDANSINAVNGCFGQPTGLSFPWNGSYIGGLRYGSKTGLPTGNQRVTLRANANCLWQTDAADTQLSVNICMNDIGEFWNGSALAVDATLNTGQTPVCLGAFIIVKPETMQKILKGEIVTSPTNDYLSQDPLKNARIWMDWSWQQNKSNYAFRHYNDNAWLNPNGQIVGDGRAKPATYPPPYNEAEARKRYDFCGQPLNINWRSSFTGQAGLASEGPDGGRIIEIPGRNNFYRGGEGAIDASTVSGQLGDFMPRYSSTSDGKAPNAATNVAPVNHLSGMPFVWGGYNTSINSIYFQQKETGDVNLGVGTQAFTARNLNPEVKGTTVFILVSTTPILVGDYMTAPLDDGNHCCFARNFVHVLGSVPTGVVNQYTITLDPQFPIMAPFLADQVIYLFRGGGKYVGAGVNAVPWAADCIIMKEYMTEVVLKAGYYTESQLGQEINEQLHDPPGKFADRVGERDANGVLFAPTTVGKAEQTFASVPSAVNGNFCHTYLPDINFGFTPVTTDNEQELDQNASTVELTNTLYTYDPEPDGAGGFVYHWPELIETSRPYNGTTVRKVTDPGGVVGHHVKIYAVPDITQSQLFKRQLHLVRLRGGALNKTDFDDGAGGTNRWRLETPRFAGTAESLRDYVNTTPGAGFIQQDYGTNQVYAYKTRMNRNTFACGGSAKIFIGANNFTFEWNEEANRFSFNNMYTPLRPHNSESKTTTEFGVDDAVPSAIICARSTGDIVGSLSGIYINNLNSDQLSIENWGQHWANNVLYQTDLTPGAQLLQGQETLDILGFNATQVAKFNNSFNLVKTPFVFESLILKSGTAIRVGPLIDPAVNGTNPFANYCTLMNPMEQYYVEVLTDDFFAADTPTKGKDPYYFIGSSFPAGRFYGNDEGQRLPVIGICARNFHSFNFAFDLGSSSITFTVEQDVTVTSIRTAIYDSNMKLATNLSSFSSVIYLVTKNQFLNPITDPQQLKTMQQMLIENATAQQELGFYSAPQAYYRTNPPPQIPNGYENSVGNLIETDDEDTDTD